MNWLTLAQTVDPISGGAGWVGAGLLGLVLAWLLLRHLPAKDQQLKDFSEAKDRHVQYLTERYEAKLDAVTSAFERETHETREEFKKALDEVLRHCEKETARLIDAFRQEMEKWIHGNADK